MKFLNKKLFASLLLMASAPVFSQWSDDPVYGNGSVVLDCMTQTYVDNSFFTPNRPVYNKNIYGRSLKYSSIVVYRDGLYEVSAVNEISDIYCREKANLNTNPDELHIPSVIVGGVSYDATLNRVHGNTYALDLSKLTINE